MVRGLPLERLWCTLLIAGLVVWASAADAGRTSRPTGKGAIRDDSVYCQNSPGQPARPEYRGTGSQNPFGGECGPGPQRQEEPQEEAEDGDSCPVREASARQTGIILVANQVADELIDDRDYQPGLWIAAGQGKWKEVLDPDQVGLGQLTVLGKKIFEAMRCSQTRMFRFTDAKRLKDTIAMREQIVKRMESLVRTMREIEAGREPAPGCILFDPLFDPRLGPRDPTLPSEWQPYRESRATLTTTMMGAPTKTAACSKPGVKAHEAILSLPAEGAMVECFWGMQMTVLDAADAALGKVRFNALHEVRRWPNIPPQIDGRPADHALVGLGVALLTDEDLIRIQVPPIQIGPRQITPPLQFGAWNRLVENNSLTSLAKHLFIVRYHLPGGERNLRSNDPRGDALAGRIEPADMVPGDWAYLKNTPRYDEFRPGGPFAGENAFYVDERIKGDPKSRVFYGFGLSAPAGQQPRFMTAEEIATQMASDFNTGAAPFRVESGDMVWTRLGAPIIDNQHPWEAGPFVPTVN